MKTVVAALMLFSATGLAQTFVAECNVDSVPTDAFYKLPLNPSIMALANEDLTNLRILDSKGQEVPYIWKVSEPEVSAPQFKEYNILQKNLRPNCCTELVLENPSLKPINNVSIIIKNAEVYKQAKLLGSDDRETWYALKDQFYIEAISNSSETYEIRILNFPLSNYRYLALNIYDSTTAPLNILKVGFYENQKTEAVFSVIPNLRFQVADSNKQKQTILSIEFDTLSFAEEIKLGVRGQPFYHRQASLYERRSAKNKRGIVEWYNQFLQHVELTSTHASTIILNGSKVQHLVLVVENNDNAPLEFISVEVYQMNRCLIAWLVKGEQYSLKIGDSKMQGPQYDIGYFADRIPEQPAVIMVSDLKLLEGKTAGGKPVSFFRSTKFIWSAIILVAALLLYMSFKIIKDTSQKGA